MEEIMAEREATLRAKSSWQQDNCIGHWLEPRCTNPSTQEAYIGTPDGSRSSNVRCCNDPRCVEYAKNLALDIL
jgi:hypothetical protein